MSEAPAKRRIGVTILGSTGSIGANTLDVLSHHRDRYQVVALTAHRNVERLYEQCRSWAPKLAVVAEAAAAEDLAARLRAIGLETEVLAGGEGLERAAAYPEADYVMAAIVGAAGLMPALAAARHGKRIMLANKEALVMAGALFMQEVHEHGAVLLPIDSEHNAVFQCLPSPTQQADGRAAERILLTASGGPFRDLDIDTLAQVTPEQACAHPNWAMGRKISVDSATMMNKGLEVIEACWLFGIDPSRIEVVLHPQSIVHSMVAYADGSVLAQLGNPDMRTPIAHALAWPERMTSGVEPLDLCSIGRLDFQQPSLERFPALGLAYEALAVGGVAPVVLNAANEIAVSRFLAGELGFMEIPRVIEATLSAAPNSEPDSLETILAVDGEARELARGLTMRRRKVS